MKIIDLLNKIANGEELPKKIKWNSYIWYPTEYSDYIKHKDDGMIDCLFDDYLHGAIIGSLNDEVEVIEDNKKIEKIDIISDEATPNSYYILNEHGTKCYMTKHSKVIADKLNEIIDKLNEVLNDKD